MSDERSIEEIRAEKIEELNESEGADAAAESPSEPVHVQSASELDEAVAAYDVVLTDFYADWCGPCQMIAPVVEEIAAETDAAVAKVDVDANQRLAQEYGVQGVPTLVLFADGDLAERIVGVRDKSSLVDLIEQHN
jgi:thioredoxin 1